MNPEKRHFFSALPAMVAIIVLMSMVLCGNVLAARVYAPDGKGYLDYITTDTGHQQPFLHLEGSGYEMGFQQGYLIPEKCAAVASNDFFLSIAVGNLSRVGLDQDVLLAPVVELLLNQFFGQSLSDYPDTSIFDIGIFVFKHLAVLNEGEPVICLCQPPLRMLMNIFLTGAYL